MHEIGGLVWVVLVIIGVVSSIVQSSRRSAAQRSVQRPQAVVRQMPVAQNAPVRQQPQPQFAMREELASIISQMAAQSQPVQQPRPPPPPPIAPAPRPAAAPVPTPVARTRKLFGDRTSLVRAVIASEVLGKPLALRDEYPRY
jgi:hypothetical protein